MISEKKLQELVDAFSYKPNWVISLRPLVYVDSLGISIKYWGPDSTNPENEIGQFGLVVPIPDILPADGFYPWLRNLVRVAELHEMDEWFKVDGIAIHDPHKSNPLSGA